MFLLGKFCDKPPWSAYFQKILYRKDQVKHCTKPLEITVIFQTAVENNLLLEKNGPHHFYCITGQHLGLKSNKLDDHKTQARSEQ